MTTLPDIIARVRAERRRRELDAAVRTVLHHLDTELACTGGPGPAGFIYLRRSIARDIVSELFFSRACGCKACGGGNG